MKCKHPSAEHCFSVLCNIWMDYSPECFLAFHGKDNYIAKRPASHTNCELNFADGSDTRVCVCDCHSSKGVKTLDHCECRSLLAGHDIGCSNRDKWRKNRHGMS